MQTLHLKYTEDGGDDTKKTGGAGDVEGGGTAVGTVGGGGRRSATGGTAATAVVGTILQGAGTVGFILATSAREFTANDVVSALDIGEIGADVAKILGRLDVESTGNTLKLRQFDAVAFSVSFARSHCIAKMKHTSRWRHR